ncbi:MAG: GNAT family N-acetyltransferase [Firmicutes bacterium]|nr:GNAT family N-acetyltransferase [Bacillota bacterium]
MIEFGYLNKNEFDKYARGLFAVLCENMSQIAPTGNDPEEDFKFWSQAMNEELQSEKRQIIMIIHKESEKIIGYFQYSVNENVFMMEEIQINQAYQGRNNIFRDLYGVVFENMEAGVEVVEAYANKKNAKSIGILGKLGLEIVGENKRGTSYLCRGTYVDLLKWFEGK